MGLQGGNLKDFSRWRETFIYCETQHWYTAGWGSLVIPRGS
jgi:hypothetical protein